jgi:hypothetical protein
MVRSIYKPIDLCGKDNQVADLKTKCFKIRFTGNAFATVYQVGFFVALIQCTVLGQGEKL